MTRSDPSRSPGRLAVDLVILPDPTLTAWAVAANATLADRRLPLGPGAGLPHVSLAMGAIAEDEIDRVAESLAALADRVPEFIPLEVDASSGVSVLRLARTPELIALHEAAMAIALSREVDASMLVGPPDERAVDWIRRYPEQAAFERFDPHVTIGVGELHAIAPLAERYPPGRLALCHLGPFCTCRRVLGAGAGASARFRLRLESADVAVAGFAEDGTYTLEAGEEVAIGRTERSTIRVTAPIGGRDRSCVVRVREGEVWIVHTGHVAPIHVDGLDVEGLTRLHVGATISLCVLDDGAPRPVVRMTLERA